MNKNFGDRLEFVAKQIFKSQKELADVLNYNRATISQIKTGFTAFGKVPQSKFKAIGINPLWLKDGVGDIFADNEEGISRRKRYYDKLHKSTNQRDSVGIFERIKEIQKSYYENFKFEIEFGAMPINVANSLANADKDSSFYIDKFRSVGFSVEYIIDGVGEMYDLDTEVGRKLRDKANGDDEIVKSTEYADLTKRDLKGLRNVLSDSISPYLSENEVLIPYYETSVRAGLPTEVFEMPTMFVKAIGVNNRSCFQVKVSGDSMEDFGIFDGDNVILDKNVKPREGKIILAMVDGEFTLKKYGTYENQPALIAGHGDYAPILLKKDVEIVAVMIRLIRDY